MLSLLLSPFFLLAALCGILIFFCFRTRKQSNRIVLILTAIAVGLLAFAATSPIPGSEGPGLLALIACGVAVGAFLILIFLHILPRPLPIPRSPAVRMSLWLVGTFLISAVAAFAVAISTASSIESATISVAVVISLFYGFSGWLMPKSNHPKKLSAVVAVLLLWSLLSGAVIFWSCVSDSMLATVFSFLTLTHRTVYPLLFSALAYGPKTAFELEILCPLAIASVQFLLSAAFGIGMLVKYQEGKR